MSRALLRIPKCWFYSPTDSLLLFSSSGYPPKSSLANTCWLLFFRTLDFHKYCRLFDDTGEDIDSISARIYVRYKCLLTVDEDVKQRGATHFFLLYLMTTTPHCGGAHRLINKYIHNSVSEIIFRFAVKIVVPRVAWVSAEKWKLYFVYWDVTWGYQKHTQHGANKSFLGYWNNVFVLLSSVCVNIWQTS